MAARSRKRLQDRQQHNLAGAPHVKKLFFHDNAVNRLPRFVPQPWSPGRGWQPHARGHAHRQNELLHASFQWVIVCFGRTL